MAKRSYLKIRDGGHLYEIVRLLRINGLQIGRHGTRAFKLRMGHKGAWAVQIISDDALRARYGRGTVEYDILRKHPRAHTVPFSKRKTHTSQHMDLVA